MSSAHDAGFINVNIGQTEQSFKMPSKTVTDHSSNNTPVRSMSHESTYKNTASFRPSK